MSEKYFQLYVRPSFWEGVARIFDFQGLLNNYNYSNDDIEADRKALEADWSYVGDDIRTAIDLFDKLNERGKLTYG